ncbi:flagellar protein FliS [Oleiphilus sp. HI0009]|uniref:flagellar export chaperone FliS n=1 Tax=unclassified Oleiphilus TaxID=2631174 RepID=UPI0007C32BF1|nr:MULTISPECIES: flagellar export chaperone FliS [unclassified Oleiphilus]KZX74944.1 flagellar protein FliS [Oleiphilus sp. HI0009]MCH2159205.1 flagellar export chaperone FliS [Oleiphilaceae bacterium]KZX84807.1 flagellar protein FliS [Oleiphilus sp. HI0009]KZY69474.1 flagellar protein FliS [Oleiphilus sp. HI0066]KZY72029.1 flagellar protein FliS [Oleiphilus sp. HI0067]
MKALNQYAAVNAQTSVVDVDRHKLIELLYDGALERINMAKARILAKDYEAKNKFINKTIDILAGLRSFIDESKAEELADNLAQLYAYCESRLLEANLKNDVELLDEVASHIRTVREGWAGIRSEAEAQGLI